MRDYIILLPVNPVNHIASLTKSEAIQIGVDLLVVLFMHYCKEYPTTPRHSTLDILSFFGIISLRILLVDPHREFEIIQ